MSSKRWDFKLDVSDHPSSLQAGVKKNLPDPLVLGYSHSSTSPYLVPAATAQGQTLKKTQQTVDKGFLDKKAWEACIQPVSAAGMNLFMIWMMGSSPGIFGIMMLVYGLTSSFATLKNVNNVFLPFQHQGLDCSLQKIAYVVLSVGVCGYLLYSASGMGLLPSQSGDWLGRIPKIEVAEKMV